MTPQRHAILHVLEHSSGHLSPRDVYKAAKKQVAGLTESTVYRTLEFLAQNGVVHHARSQNGRAAYQTANNPHHHLTCRFCGADVELDATLFQDIFKKIERKSGFRFIDDHLTFLAVCPACR